MQLYNLSFTVLLVLGCIATIFLWIEGGPAPPNVSLRVVNATTLQLSWDPPFTWPEYKLLNYTVRMENRRSNITAEPVVLPPSDLTYTLTASSPVQHCADLRFNITASNALGDSAPAVVTGGFPKGKG